MLIATQDKCAKNCARKNKKYARLPRMFLSNSSEKKRGISPTKSNKKRLFGGHPNSIRRPDNTGKSKTPSKICLKLFACSIVIHFVFRTEKYTFYIRKAFSARNSKYPLRAIRELVQNHIPIQLLEEDSLKSILFYRLNEDQISSLCR